MTDCTALLIGRGTVETITGPYGTTPPCPQAKFAVGDILKCRRLRGWSMAGQRGVVAAVVPPGFSPDWAWADLRQEPRPLMYQVPLRVVSYILATESGRAVNIKERYLLATGERGSFAWSDAAAQEDTR